jgi:hypothetical protein
MGQALGALSIIFQTETLPAGEGTGRSKREFRAVASRISKKDYTHFGCPVYHGFYVSAAAQSAVLCFFRWFGFRYADDEFAVQG